MKLNDFVDVVFVINLPQRNERLIETTKQLDSFGISFVVWEAIKDDNGVIGLVKTMQFLLSHCQSSGYKRVCIFEDDINIIRPQLNELMDECIEQLPEDFDLFYMGGNLMKQPSRVSPNILKTPLIYATHAIIYSKKAIEHILPQLNEYMPYDLTLANSIQKLNNCYCAFPLLISQKKGFSDIEKRVVDYDMWIEKQYDRKTKGI